MRETWQAREMFFDPFVRVVEASGKDEVRDALIGMTREGQFLFVVRIEYTAKISRPISARPTTMAERRRYESG